MCSGTHARDVSVLVITIIPLGVDRPEGQWKQNHGIGSDNHITSRPEPRTCLKGPWRRRFGKLHGNLLRLLEIETQPAALEALA
ncbi:hypothetical protein CR513_47698, partial [Mucuna pruriens]